MRIMTLPGSDGNAVPPDHAPSLPDPRAQAFAEFLESVDHRDWRAGQLATRRLRALGLAVCLVTPPGDRRGA